MKIKAEEKRDYVIITYTLGKNTIDEVCEVFNQVSKVFYDKRVIAIPSTINISDYLDEESAIKLLESVNDELKKIKENKKNGKE